MTLGYSDSESKIQTPSLSESISHKRPKLESGAAPSGLGRISWAYSTFIRAYRCTRKLRLAPTADLALVSTALQMFFEPLDEDLMKEDRRLERLSKRTCSWWEQLSTGVH